MTSIKASRVHYEEVPSDPTSSLAVREFDAAAFTFNWHYHPEVELALIVKGQGLRFVGDSVEEFSDGDLCLLGSNTPHSWVSHKDAAPGVSSLHLQFQPEAWGVGFRQLPEMRGIGELLKRAGRGLVVRGAARQRAEDLFLGLMQQPQGSLQRFQTLLEMLQCIAQSRDCTPLAGANFALPARKEPNSKIGRVLDYIRSHLGPELTQQEVAHAARLSVAAFSQFFRRSMGTSYVSYVNEIKIRNACRALFETDQPVTEVAFAAGFNSLSHFNAQFLRRRHTTPRAYRLRLQAGDGPGGTSRKADPRGLASGRAGQSASVLDRDVTVHGRSTILRGVRAGTEEPRPWQTDYAVCPALSGRQIIHVGIVEAHFPYQIVRTKQTTSYFLACFGGEGRVLADGRWRIIRPGLACLLPAHVRNAFEALPGAPWQFAHACYLDPLGQRGLASPASPLVAPYDADRLRFAILGLEAECRAGARSAEVERWIDLIHGYVTEFARPIQTNGPLPALWQKLFSRLNEDWSLTALANEAGCSPESLRRSCQEELGRSPMEHVTYLRMRRAAELLATTDLKLIAIANATGYADSQKFCVAFKSHVGCHPVTYRRRAFNGARKS